MCMRKTHVVGSFLIAMAESSSSSQSTACALLPLEKDKSAVWEYFGFPSRDGEFIEKIRKKNHRLLQTTFEEASVPWYYNEHDDSIMHVTMYLGYLYYLMIISSMIEILSFI